MTAPLAPTAPRGLDEPSHDAEQAAWHAGIDEGRRQERDAHADAAPDAARELVTVDAALLAGWRAMAEHNHPLCATALRAACDALDVQDDNAAIGASYMEWVAKNFPEEDWDYDPVEVANCLLDERDELRDALSAPAHEAPPLPWLYRTFARPVAIAHRAGRIAARRYMRSQEGRGE